MTVKETGVSRETGCDNWIMGSLYEGMRLCYIPYDVVGLLDF